MWKGRLPGLGPLQGIPQTDLGWLNLAALDTLFDWFAILTMIKTNWGENDKWRQSEMAVAPWKNCWESFIWLGEDVLASKQKIGVDE